jgi:acetyl-CoA carboxylase biotin carboxylase subunit
MFKRILVANRGEIALRIIRACHELEIEAVLVHSEADANSLPVTMADRAICIGPPETAQSYLNVQAIISAAEIAQVDAIHPGYGFLAENAQFAEICEACGYKFIGPSPQVITMLGDKASARKFVEGLGVPVIPGSRGEVDSEENALEVAERIGFPVIIKASAGGGGRGMRIARNVEELSRLYKTARTEAEAAFGEPSVYLERYIKPSRHIEVQVIGNNNGEVLCLGERECSLQRRHQKVMEESPALISEERRKQLYQDAVTITREIGYTSAGTVEFLLDEEENHYFIEMNTRIQVEHPVTEMVTGMDLVKEQIRVAADLPFSCTQDDIIPRGWAIEFRINAEDPHTFTPSPGTITTWVVPGGPGVRVDTAMYQGYTVPPFYDSLVAKLIVWGKDREEAIKRGKRTLREFRVDGIETTIPLHLAILESEDFKKGKCHTSWLDNFTFI